MPAMGVKIVDRRPKFEGDPLSLALRRCDSAKKVAARDDGGRKAGRPSAGGSAGIRNLERARASPAAMLK